MAAERAVPVAQRRNTGTAHAMKFAGVPAKTRATLLQGKWRDLAQLRHIEILFQDKTSLRFDLELRVQVVPELVNRKSGSYKPLKCVRPISQLVWCLRNSFTTP